MLCDNKISINFAFANKSNRDLENRRIFMKHFLYVLVGIGLLTACSPFQKALKVDDSAYKNEIADQLYEKGKYKQAIRLYEQIEHKEGWAPNYQSMFYKFSKSYYNAGKWEVAGPMLQRFNSLYFNSPNREETLYLEAMAAYELSENYTLDQHITYEAINKFETFLTAYPEAENATEAQKYLKELNEKLEKKAYEAARLYNKIGEYTRDYNAAIVALDNFLKDYPGTVYKTEALYYKFDSAYKLAMNSVYSKMEERIENAALLYEDLMAFEPENEYKDEAKKMMDRLNKELQQFSTK